MNYKQALKKATAPDTHGERVRGELPVSLRRGMEINPYKKIKDVCTKRGKCDMI